MTPHFLASVLLYVLPILVVLGVVVTVHELGHFLTARALGTKVERFSIGFGRPIAAWRAKSGVEWRVGWIPLGGYVKFAGDENAASVPDQDDLSSLRRQIVAEEGPDAVGRYFHFKPLWQRALIVAAGPVANFVLAIAIFAGLLMAFGEAYAPPRVVAVAPASAAARAGFQAGDLIVSADGKEIANFDDFKVMVLLRSDTPIQVVVRRGGKDVALTATPERGEVRDQLGNVQRLGRLGITGPSTSELKIRRFTPPEAIVRGAQEAWGRIATTVDYIGRLVGGREKADQLAGPLGMAQLSGDIAKKTAQLSPDVGAFTANMALNVLQLIASISVGVGFLNLLPIPVLDGGHLLFYGYEAVARRPLTAHIQAAGYRVGLALVLGLMLFATWNDLQRLNVFKLFGALFS